jgi:hypothetical protein
MNEQQLRKEAERLIKAGKMPTLGELTQAILSTRRDYASKIRRARREGELGKSIRSEERHRLLINHKTP